MEGTIRYENESRNRICKVFIKTFSGKDRLLGGIYRVIGGYQYWPEYNERLAGEIFNTLDEVKKSLEEE